LRTEKTAQPARVSRTDAPAGRLGVL